LCRPRSAEKPREPRERRDGDWCVSRTFVSGMQGQDTLEIGFSIEHNAPHVARMNLSSEDRSYVYVAVCRHRRQDGREPQRRHRDDDRGR
jgi:hypothetical protein